MKKRQLSLNDISSALACVYCIVPELNNGKPILHVFNTDEEAKTFYDNHNTKENNGYYLLFKIYERPRITKRYEICKIVCSELLWLHIGFYQGCVTETVCTTTLLKNFIDSDEKNPYFKHMELYTQADFDIIC